MTLAPVRRPECLDGSVKSCDSPSQDEIRERSVGLPARVSTMPGSLVSSCYNFSHHRSNAATQDFLIHQHDCYELYYYVSGDMRFLYDGTEYALSPHTLILVVPGVLHGIRVLSEKTYERYTFHFTSRIFAGEREGLLLRLLPTLDSVRKRNSFIPFFLEGCDRFPVLKKLNAILSLPDLDIGPENEQILASSLMESLLIHLYLIHAKDASLAAPRPAEKDPPELAEILDYLRRHPSERITLDRLSQRFYISRSQLNNLFQRHFHTGAMGYITLQRLSYARKLLRSGIPAAEAAAAIGYSDYSTFYRAYLRHMGHSPADDKSNADTEWIGYSFDPEPAMEAYGSRSTDQFPDISFENNVYDPLE